HIDLIPDLVLVQNVVQIAKSRNGLAVDSRDDVAHDDSGPVRRRTGLDFADDRPVDPLIADGFEPHAGMGYLSKFYEPRNDLLDQVNRDREAGADASAVSPEDHSRHAHHVRLRIKEPSSRITWIDRRVRLDHPAHGSAGAHELAVEGADDPSRHRSLETERVADSQNFLADLKAVRIA